MFQGLSTADRNRKKKPCFQNHIIKMGHRKAGTRLPSFCLDRIRPPRGGVRLPSLRFQRKTADGLDSGKTEQPKQEEEDNGGAADDGSVGGLGRKIMVVVDSTAEAKAALQWALTHTVQSQDTLILLHATKQGDKGSVKKKMAPRSYEFVHTMKKMCNNKRPEVQVEIAVVEGREKGAAIVEEAKKQGVSMLVLGQKKKGSTTWRLLMMWAGSRVAAATAGGGGVVEYCIQNAECMAIAVRRKSNKLGGYLITTKRHKDFWLLA